MLDATDTKHAPWHILHSDDKKRARLNCISHLLSQIPYEKLPKRRDRSAETIEASRIRRPGNVEMATIRTGIVLSLKLPSELASWRAA